MNAGRAALEQLRAQLDSRAHADLSHLLSIVFVELELGQEVSGNARAAHAGEALDLRDIGDGHDARHDRHGDTNLASPLDEAKVRVGFEEELGDQEVGAAIDLQLERSEV